MRWLFVALVAGAFGLQSCSPSTSGDAAAVKLTEALHVICEPWMHGVVREVLDETLVPQGWTLTETARLLESGVWGRVEVTLLQTGSPLQRACLINFNSSLEPWSLEAASAAVDHWIASAYPKAVKTTGGLTVVGGRKVLMQAWVLDDLKFARGEQLEKQTAPTFDLFFMVRRD